MVFSFPNSKKKVSFERFMQWLDALSQEQKQAIYQKLKADELAQTQSEFQQLAESIPSPGFSEAEILAEIKAYRSEK